MVMRLVFSISSDRTVDAIDRPNYALSLCLDHDMVWEFFTVMVYG